VCSSDLFNSAPRAGTAEVYEHEMPGGQYTNLREQANAMGLGHRWREIARTYADVNQLFGDIVKVTPSSKVVGDMAMFLITRGIKAADVPKLKPGSIDWPESVIDMLAGGLGQPDGGWPADVQKVVLNQKPATTKRPGELAESINLRQTKEHLSDTLKREASEDDLYSHLMYPKVFEDFCKTQGTYYDLSSIPTPAFFYGLRPSEEIEVVVEQPRHIPNGVMVLRGANVISMRGEEVIPNAEIVIVDNRIAACFDHPRDIERRGPVRDVDLILDRQI
jgi:pyruvate carboxylase